MSKAPKYYVVWRGRQPGVYATWADCFAQINGFSGSSHKAFNSLELAEEAFRSQREDFVARHPELYSPVEGERDQHQSRLPIAGEPIPDSYAVDAACSGNPGPLEYRCVQVATRVELFRQGPFPNGTSNIGEFLAIVHALAFFKKRGISAIIYSDSTNAISWVHQKTCRTKLVRDEGNTTVFELIGRAEMWLRSNDYDSPVLKWETEVWGENPADFGRKN